MYVGPRAIGRSIADTLTYTGAQSLETTRK